MGWVEEMKGLTAKRILLAAAAAASAAAAAQSDYAKVW